jgi:hypothetical protein
MARLVNALLLLAVVVPAGVGAQDSLAAIRARTYRAEHETAIVRELTTLLAVPNTAADTSGRAQTARAIMRALEQRGMSPQLLGAPGSPPAVYAELKSPRASTTVMIYAHYDGQPVNPVEWKTPAFQPTLRSGPLSDATRLVALPAAGSVPRDWRIYARSASDDKAAIVRARQGVHPPKRFVWARIRQDELCGPKRPLRCWGMWGMICASKGAKPTRDFACSEVR